MTNDIMENKYFDWLCRFVVNNKKKPMNTYRQLLTILHDTTFEPNILHDSNRMYDGLDLRKRYSRNNSTEYISDRPCSILEMMVALSLRMEEQIMDDPDIGNRTSLWFWTMIRNMGLFSYSDDKMTVRTMNNVRKKLRAFNDRDYQPNGRGGLFIVKNCDKDMRDVEIWYQMCWYLNSLM